MCIVKKLRIRLLGILIGLGLNQVQAQSAQELLTTYQSLSKSQREDSSTIPLLLQISSSFFYNKPDTSILFANYALELAQKHANITYQAEAIRNRGVVNYVQGDYVDAIQEFAESDSLFKLAGNKRGEMRIANVMGLIHGVWEDHESAINYYTQGLRLAEQIPARDYYSTLFYNLAITYSTDNKPDSALLYFKQTNQIAAQFNDTLMLMRSFMMMGDVTTTLDKPLIALSHLEQAKSLIKPDNFWDLGYLYGTFARTYEKMGFLSQAQKYGEQALAIEEQIHAKWELLRVHKILASIYEKQGKLQKSVFHFKTYDAYRDSLFDSQKQQTVARLGLAQKALENERLYHENIEKQQTVDFQRLGIFFLGLFLTGFVISLIIVLRVNNERKMLNEKLIHQNAELDKLNGLKNEILSIIGHDMINMTTSLGGFINMFNMKEITAEQFASIAPALEENVERVRLSFNNLFRWAESQKEEFTTHPERMVPQKVFQEVLHLFQPIAKRKEIRLEIQCEPDIQFTFDEYHLVLILRNLVHNAIKFTPNAGLIILYAQHEQQHIRIGVKDSGLGMSEEIRTQLLSTEAKRFSKPGARNETGTGLGLIASKRFLALNGAELHIESEEGKGSDFYFYVS